MINDLDYSFLEKYDLEILEKLGVLVVNETKIYIELLSFKSKNDYKTLENYFCKPLKINRIEERVFIFIIEQLKYKITINNLAKKCIELDNTNHDDEKLLKSFFEHILHYLIKINSSDLHIEVHKKKTILKARVDGELEKVFEFEYVIFSMLSAIIKLQANLDVAQKRMPQDGRCSLSLNDINYDFRISIIPTINNLESIVIRILDKTNQYLNIKKIGLSNKQLEIVEKHIHSMKGMILVTGATGSGKTTTIYSIINSMNKIKKKIITVEDPVEYDIDGINQINIDEKRGLSFSNILKNILRQDPDVIFIGEIRDKESLKLAIQAALTGHLVIATLHTNDTIKTIDRLYDLGAEPFLIASVLKLVISQKLVKILCENCKEVYIYKEEIISKSVGCSKCKYQGHNKRELLMELLEVTPEIEKQIHQKNTSLIQIKRSEKLNTKLYNKLLNREISIEEYMSNAF